MIESYVSLGDSRLLHQRGHRGGWTRRDAHALQDAAREPARVSRAHDRRAAGARQPLRVVLVRDRRGALAHEHLHESRWRGVRRHAQRPVHGGRRAAHGPPDAHRARAAQLLQPRDLQGHPDGSAHGVFNGKVYVHPIAQKTDGKQTNNNLLLSERRASTRSRSSRSSPTM